MKILSSVALTVFPFTWDPNNPSFSTNGQYDPAKIKAGVGSCYLDLETESVNADLPHLSHSSEPETITTSVSIIGVGVIPP
jgi:hypothetical protein